MLFTHRRSTKHNCDLESAPTPGPSPSERGRGEFRILERGTKAPRSKIRVYSSKEVNNVYLSLSLFEFGFSLAGAGMALECIQPWRPTAALLSVKRKSVVGTLALDGVLVTNNVFGLARFQNMRISGN